MMACKDTVFAVAGAFGIPRNRIVRADLLGLAGRAVIGSLIAWLVQR